uniref:Uncharacterized protein n=1 Tax=Anguilla anguilla TaxID=7936 RepID=A0A0E9WGB1_ANGAN
METVIVLLAKVKEEEWYSSIPDQGPGLTDSF